MISQAQLRQQITAQIVAALEQNLLPWRRPWSVSKSNGRHSNAITGRPYRGINPLLLEVHAFHHGFTSNWWASFEQWNRIGGNVRPRPSGVEPGAWGAKIVFYRQVRTTVRDTKTGEEEKETYLVLKSWTVFNVEQVEGDIVSKYRAALPAGPVEPDFGPAEQLLTACGANIRNGGDKAFYARPIPEGVWPNHRDGDYVVLPPRQQFNSVGAFYETAFHELAHWSEVRLDWNNKERGYALGELVAEISACYLAQELGVPQGEAIENHAAYLKSWIKEMKDDARFVFQASSQASKVADFLTSFVRPAAVADEAA